MLVDKLTYDFTEPEPGDVVVFKGPASWAESEFTAPQSRQLRRAGPATVGSVVGLAPPDERDFVKRVIAVGGQTVMCCDAKNRVVVDGKPLNEPYIYWSRARPPKQRPFPAGESAGGHLWVMGDNRNNSYDSRYQGRAAASNGVVPSDHVIGKARLIVLPPCAVAAAIGDDDPQEQASALGAPSWQQGLPPLGAGLAGRSRPCGWAADQARLSWPGGQEGGRR